MADAPPNLGQTEPVEVPEPKATTSELPAQPEQEKPVHRGLPRLWNRLRDRKKWPRSWWYPVPEYQVFSSVEAWQRQHDDVSKTIRTVITTLLVLSAYCIATLVNNPDIKLLDPEVLVNLPLANSPLAFGTFLTVGPLAIIAVALYLHRFIGYWGTLQAPASTDPDSARKLPYMFNLDDPLARLYTGFVFYWLVPLLLALFALKSSPRREGDAVALLAFAVAFGSLWLSVRRSSEKRPWLILRLTRTFVVLVVAVGFALALLVGESLFSRGLDLSGEDLKGRDLGAVVLEEANRMNGLRWADLRGANITGSDLSGVNLSGANLTSANLSKAILGGANLSEANLFKANLSEADLPYAKVGGANLLAAHLFAADLTEADLGGANLSGAYLGGADLYGVDLLGAKNLTCEQLAEAGNWEKAYRDPELACGAPIPEPRDEREEK